MPPELPDCCDGPEASGCGAGKGKPAHLSGSGAYTSSFVRISSGILATLLVLRFTITHVLQVRA